MKLTYGGQTIDFFDFDLPRKVTLSLSGGLDSAAFMYLICTNFSQIEIAPYTAADVSFPADKEAAVAVATWMSKHFPSNRIQDLHIEEIDQYNLSKAGYKQMDWYRENRTDLENIPDSGVSKLIQINVLNKKIRNLHNGAINCNAMTANPPESLMKSRGFDHLAERRRHQGQELNQFHNNLYRPFINVDKRFVADVYRKHNLLETLFPLTKSCIGTAEKTNNHTQECGECFWCYEKNWAFEIC